jgi:hypothetical protein
MLLHVQWPPSESDTKGTDYFDTQKELQITCHKYQRFEYSIPNLSKRIDGVAPTWSWASIDSQVEFFHHPYLDASPCIRIIDTLHHSIRQWYTNNAEKWELTIECNLACGSLLDVGLSNDKSGDIHHRFDSRFSDPSSKYWFMPVLYSGACQDSWNQWIVSSITGLILEKDSRGEGYYRRGIFSRHESTGWDNWTTWQRLFGATPATEDPNDWFTSLEYQKHTTIRQGGDDNLVADHGRLVKIKLVQSCF